MELPRSAIMITRSRKLNLKLVYQLTHKTMICREVPSFEQIFDRDNLSSLSSSSATPRFHQSLPVRVNSKSVARPQDGNGDGIASFDIGAYEAPAVDHMAPSTTASPSPLPNASGWEKTNVTVSLSAVDNQGGTGVKQIQFSTSGAQNGGTQVVSGGASSVTISAEGSTMLTYNAVDYGGNVEAAKMLTLKIDKTAPIIAAMPGPGCTLQPANHQLVQVANVTATDALSGVKFLSVSATSNEPHSGTGGGDKPGDIIINGGVVQLRTERSPSGNARIDTITAAAADFAGNVVSATATCIVPK
jgi:hypothetical protein